MVCVSGFGQTDEKLVFNQYPILLQASLPFYPPVAHGLRFGGTIEIDVTVEDGIVKDAKVKSEIIEPPSGKEKEFQSNAKLLQFLTVPSLENLKTWRFKKEDSGHFVVTFIYKMEGDETLYPVNDKIEMDLPFIFKITARPLMPEQSPPLRVPPYYKDTPWLQRAEIPFYPLIAANMRFGGTVEIDAIVKDGIVKKADITRETMKPPIGKEEWQSNTAFMQHLTASSLENLKTWQFEHVTNGRFAITFIYEIEGEEAPFSLNDKIELDLPLTVKITARTFKSHESPDINIR